jgi:hypothetical protein
MTTESITKKRGLQRRIGIAPTSTIRITEARLRALILEVLPTDSSKRMAISGVLYAIEDKLQARPMIESSNGRSIQGWHLVQPGDVRLAICRLTNKVKWDGMFPYRIK